jgi:hypothetical protein
MNTKYVLASKIILGQPNACNRLCIRLTVRPCVGFFLTCGRVSASFSCTVGFFLCPTLPPLPCIGFFLTCGRFLPLSDSSSTLLCRLLSSLDSSSFTPLTASSLTASLTTHLPPAVKPTPLPSYLTTSSITTVINPLNIG